MPSLFKKQEAGRGQGSRFSSCFHQKMHGVVFDRLSLRFSEKSNEDRYVETHYFQNLQHIRASLLVAVFLFILLGALDFYLFPGEHWRMWAVRLFTVAPFALFLVLLSYTKEWRIVQPAAAFAILIAGITNIAIIVHDASYLGSVYFIGMVLFLLYGYTVLRLRYVWMVRAGLGMILFYEIIALFVVRLPPDIFLINNVFLIAANISGMFASYTIEYFSRRDFVQNMLLVKSADGLALSLSDRSSHLHEFINNTREVVLFQLRLDGDEILVEKVSPIIQEKLRLKKEDIKKIQNWFLGSAKNKEVLLLIQQAAKDKRRLDLEIEHVFLDGDKGWFRLVTLAADDRQSKSVHVLGMVLDITSERENTRKQKELVKQKSKFLNVISHQFNTPLNVVKWAAETLRNQDVGSLNQQQETLVIGMQRASDLMIEILQDVIAGMTMLERRSVSIQKKVFTVAEFVMPVLSHLEARLQNRGFVLRGEQLGAISLEGDLEKLQIVITKVIENALDYSDEGEDILLSLEKDKKELVLVCKNKGIGIPIGEKSKIFDLFYRGDLATKKQPNRSGVGLSLARLYVEAHGGSIEVEAEKNNVMVIVRLPL